LDTHSQKHASRKYTWPNKSGPYNHILFPEDQLYCSILAQSVGDANTKRSKIPSVLITVFSIKTTCRIDRYQRSGGACCFHLCLCSATKAWGGRFFRNVRTDVQLQCLLTLVETTSVLLVLSFSYSFRFAAVFFLSSATLRLKAFFDKTWNQASCFF